MHTNRSLSLIINVFVSCRDILYISRDIILQQDNAKPHITNENPNSRIVATLMDSTPKSLDFNVNDLSWFRSLQSLQQSSPSYTIDELVKVVDDSFNELDPTKLNKVFFSLQACMVEMLKHKGHNKYSSPHMKKDTLIRE